MPDATVDESADHHFRVWLRRCLSRAAERFGVIATGDPVFGWRLRSISAPTRDDRGRRLWLRVVTEDHRWLPGDFWTGNFDANVIVGVAKPSVLGATEWSDSHWHREVRAELMTFMPGESCSPTDVLRAPIELPNTWWIELRRNLDVVHSVSTSRVNVDQQKYSKLVHSAFGERVALGVETWQTVHGDLHWGNLRRPQFGLLDWEMWGRGPLGLDEATLYCYSLLVDAATRTVHESFGPLLDSRAGRIAQVYASARLLRRADEDFPDLAAPLRWHMKSVIERLRIP